MPTQNVPCHSENALPVIPTKRSAWRNLDMTDRRLTQTLKNKTNKRMNRFLLKTSWLLCALLALLTASCADEEAPVSTQRSGLVKLVLPGVLGSGTRATVDDDAQGHTGSYIPVNGSDPEGVVDSEKGLWFFAFDAEDGTKVIAQNILKGLPEAVDEYNHKEYQVEVPFGEYHFYLAGNIDGLASSSNEDALKQTVLSYTSDLTNELKPGKLPMYRSAVEVTIGAGQVEEVDMHMVFLCSKVSITVSREDGETANVTKLELGHVAAKSIADKEECGKYELTEFLGEDDARISVFDAANPTTATFYLPEYYNTDKDDATYLYITLDEKEYKLPLGGDNYTSTPVKDVPGGNLERGVHYDISAVKARTDEDWTLNLGLFKWTTETLDVDLSKTTLWVEKTGGYQYTGTDSEVKLVSENDTILATSLIPATLRYETNASTLDVECTEAINDKPILVATTDSKNEILTFTINPELTITDFANAGQTEGVCKVTLTANNLKKEIWVSYNVTPFLTVTPTKIVFGGDNTATVKTVMYSTNLPYVSLSGKDNMDVVLQEESNIITVTAQTNGSSNTFYVVASTEDLNAGNTSTVADAITLTQAVNVLYKRTDNIRVNFIAVNDGLVNGAADLVTPEPLYAEGASNSVNYEYENSLPQTYSSSEGAYRFGTPYVKFNTTNETKAMTADGTGGWYFTTDNTNAAQVRFSSQTTFSNGSTTAYYVLPNSGNNSNDTPYQYPYKGAMMPLFNFENNEGWLVWDPTIEACEFLDFKPEVVEVEYDVYVYSETPVQGVRWYRRYGWIQNNVGRFLIQSEPDTNGAYTTYLVYDVGNNWYKTTIKLKSTKHDKHKEIKLIFRTASGSIDTGMIYGGEDYSVATGENRCEGYFDASGAWNKGVPADASTSGTKTNVTVNLAAFGDENGGSYNWANRSTQGHNGYVRVYFYNPQEPSSWVNPLFQRVYLHMGFTQGYGGRVSGFDNWPIGGVKSNDYLEPVVVEGDTVPHWYYYEISNKYFHGYDLDNQTHADGTRRGFNDWPEGNDEFMAKYPQYYARWKIFRAANNSQLLYLAFRTQLYDEEHDATTYKSDLWAWANMYNGFFPDIRIAYNPSCSDNRIKDRYENDSYVGNNSWPSGYKLGENENAVALYCMDGKCYINQRPR